MESPSISMSMGTYANAYVLPVAHLHRVEVCVVKLSQHLQVNQLANRTTFLHIGCGSLTLKAICTSSLEPPVNLSIQNGTCHRITPLRESERPQFKHHPNEHTIFQGLIYSMPTSAHDLRMQSLSRRRRRGSGWVRND